MTEGVVRKWNFKVGDTIKSGDILAEVETDKATMDLENYEKGTILHFAIGEGDAAPVDGVIAIVGKAGEDFSALLSSGASAAPSAPVVETAKVETVTSNPVVASAPVQSSSSDNRLKVSPLAKKLAAEKGVDLSSVAGSGDRSTRCTGTWSASSPARSRKTRTEAGRMSLAAIRSSGRRFMRRDSSG